MLVFQLDVSMMTLFALKCCNKQQQNNSVYMMQPYTQGVKE